MGAIVVDPAAASSRMKSGLWITQSHDLEFGFGANPGRRKSGPAQVRAGASPGRRYRQLGSQTSMFHVA
jgi:hypothetical protein